MTALAIPDVLSLADAATDAARAYLRLVQRACHEAVAPDGRVDPARAEAEQRRVHGFAWVATAVEGLAQLASWASRLAATETLGPGEQLVLRIGFGEYLAQLLGGLPMSQTELVRPSDLGARDDAA